MKHTYFNCKKKGKVLVLFFEDEKDITKENLIKYINEDFGRYLKLVLEKQGHKVCVNMIKFEIENEEIIKDSVNWLMNDLNDYININLNK